MTRADLIARARHVAAVADKHSDDVDQRARFPFEAVDAAREAGLLADSDADVLTLVEVAKILGRACGSTAMIWAMHQVQLTCVARHGGESPALGEFLTGAGHLLIASVTSEVGVGGDIRHSEAAAIPGPTRFTLEKQATTVSYGAQADAFLITVRRDPDARPSDQVAVFVRRDQVLVERTGNWDPMGMRGTCSPGFLVRAEFPAEQVLPAPFADIAEQTMVPLSHILWSAVWLGLATEAFERARRLTRKRSHTGSTELAGLDALLTGMETQLSDAAQRYTSALAGDAPFATALAVRLNALKLAASSTAVAIAGQAMEICGMAGYQERGEHTIARILRDLHSAPLMIANRRLAEANASSLLVLKRG